MAYCELNKSGFNLQYTEFEVSHRFCPNKESVWW